MKELREKLKNHIGHNVVCASYGDKENPKDITIECVDCNEVLISCETIEDEPHERVEFTVPKLVGCLYCGNISRYHKNEIKGEMTRPNEYRSFIICKKCRKKVYEDEWRRYV